MLATALAVATVVGTIPTSGASAANTRRAARSTVARPAGATPGTQAATASTPDPTAPAGPRRAFSGGPNAVALSRDITNGQAIVRSGSVASLAGQVVPVGGTRQATIGSLAEQALAPARSMQSKLPQAASALFGSPVLSEEVAETADATILTSRTSFTVTDRAALGRQVPELGGFTPGTARLNQLSPGQRQAFDSYRRSLASKPAGHPLREASNRGDQALLDALATGVADVTITTNVRVEKLPTPASGRFAVLNGPAGIPAVAAPAGTASVAGPAGAPQGNASGQVDHTAKFLTGWSLGDSLHWSTKADYGLASLEVGFHAGYTVGLRVPVELRGTMTPSLVERRGSGAFRDSYEVSVHDVAAVDGDAAHYRNVGLATDLIADGDEFALEADAYAFAKGEVLGSRFDERFPRQPLFDEGKNMRPPYGDCGPGCGLDFFFPCNLTKTCIDVLGIVTGGAQVGFNVGGTGSLSYTYASLVNGDVASSTRRSTGETARTHRVTTDGRTGMTQRFDTVLPADGSSIRFGYRLSDPVYEWNVAITPLVKAGISFDYVVGTAQLDFGPYRLPISVDVGTIRLGVHDGTRTSTDKVDGAVRVDLRALDNPVGDVQATPGASAGTAGSGAGSGSGNGGGRTTTAAPGTTAPGRKKKQRATTVPAVATAPITAAPKVPVTRARSKTAPARTRVSQP